tara:strand:- start:323 stop:1285 length:963 start_codon:yes stop_codon:yes gene_type:complete
MSIYLGTFGRVELQRQFDGNELLLTVPSGDVNSDIDRFGFTFNEPSEVSDIRDRSGFSFRHNEIVTGDQIEITTTGDSAGSALSFIDNYTKTSIKKFVNVDEIGGFRLYNSFTDAINNVTANAVQLSASYNTTLNVRVKVENAERRILAQCSSFELNTERETVDTTALSDEFRNRISTLMSGSGRMSCFWEYVADTDNDTNELPNYLLELLLRTKVGSQFNARFYLKTDQQGYNKTASSPSSVSGAGDHEVWYEFKGVLTACAVQFSPTDAVQFTADFITTGPIQIRMALAEADLLLLENDGEVRTDESDSDTAERSLLQ